MAKWSWRAGALALVVVGGCELSVGPIGAPDAAAVADPDARVGTPPGIDSGAELLSDAAPDLEPDAGQPESLSFPVRGAFYYPWFPETWTVGGEHVFYDVDLGYYDSADAAVVDRHIESMDYGGIQVAIASWWGVGTHAEATRIPLLFDRTVALGSPLKWTFYYEKEGFGDPSVAEIEADLDYLTDNYAGSDRMALVGGKPVIFVYNADDSDCEVATRWRLASNGEWYVVLKVFGGFRDCPDQPNGWHQYGPGTAAQRHAGYSHVISPGLWRADQTAPALARDIVRFSGDVRDLVATGEPWQLITTFNEWGEGTAIETAAEWQSASGFGQYLDALHYDGLIPSL